MDTVKLFEIIRDTLFSIALFSLPFWLLLRKNREYDRIDVIRSSLRRAGWTVWDDIILGGFAVTARRGEHVIRAQSSSELEAWRKALEHARALEFLDQEEPRLDPGAVTKGNDHITRFGEPPSGIREGR
ncbi:MAG TPA: hypothetical protein VMG10_36365 [Gemmataceae bacterium]|nr:hypothetical protein [Gemmataceae bacterium]